MDLTVIHYIVFKDPIISKINISCSFAVAADEPFAIDDKALI